MFRGSRTVLFVCLGAWCVAGQESIQYGNISGRVEDPSGAAVAGAKVSSRQKETNAGSTVLTDREGRFRFAYLSAGEYEIAVEYPGFAKATRTVRAGAGSAFELAIGLKLAASEDEVRCRAKANSSRPRAPKLP